MSPFFNVGVNGFLARLASEKIGGGKRVDFKCLKKGKEEENEGLFEEKGLLQSRRECDLTPLLLVPEQLILLLVSLSKTNGVALSSCYHVS